ncbi:hypothetical protein V6N11_051808 [Hibiscus sabdariffa]|uniref:Uncharacterized protein n=1 Tax=Hibiscus sabdariffa TaxID=183260 RepID=A0ABR2U8D9_9ROSI
MPHQLVVRNVSRLWRGLRIVWEDVCSNVAWVLGEESVKVASMVTAHGEWDWSQFHHLLPQRILLHIAAIQCPTAAFRCEIPIWAADRRGQFSIKSAYRV